MIGRREVMKGAVMAFGGLPPRRPDQRIPAQSRAGSGPAPASGLILRAREVIAGNSPAPQVLINSGLDYAVTTYMPATGLPASDVRSIAPIQTAVQFPSNNAAELAPPLIAETLITYTDGSVSDALLILSGFTGTAGASVGRFELLVSGSSTGADLQATITGYYQFSGGTITLTPQWYEQLGFLIALVPASEGGLLLAAAPGSTGGLLLPPGDEFGSNSLGSTGLAGDGGSAAYQLMPDGTLHLSIHKSFTALLAITTATFANVLPAAYIPPASRLTSGDPIALNGAAIGVGTRLTITGGTGAVNLVNLPVGCTGAGADVRIPLN